MGSEPTIVKSDYRDEPNSVLAEVFAAREALDLDMSGLNLARYHNARAALGRNAFARAAVDRARAFDLADPKPPEPKKE